MPLTNEPTADGFDEAGLEARGFEGFRRFVDLISDQIPKGPGVYIVLRAVQDNHVALSRSVGGRFKGKDPSVDLRLVEERMQCPSATLYIGKADAGTTAQRGLRKRITELAKFGEGRPVGHWGGRYLWQLSESQELRVAWMEIEEGSAREAEQALFAEFMDLYGRLPFANLRT